MRYTSNVHLCIFKTVSQNKSLIIFVVIFLSALMAVGQKRNIRFEGSVLDTTNSTPVFATIHIYYGGKHVSQGITDKSGQFAVSVDTPGIYSIKVQSLGYVAKILFLPTGNNSPVVKIPPIFLKNDVTDLKLVTIAGKRQLAKQYVDHISYEVKDDPESKTASTFEILRKVPLIDLGMNESITVNGRQSFIILINGKPSAILNKDPASYLRNLKALNVDHIDVMTTPPSKYSQTGTTEVINIITKDGIVEGAQASVRTTYSTLNDPFASLTADVKKKWFGLSLYSSLTHSSAHNLNTYSTIVPIHASVNNVSQFSVLKRTLKSFNEIPEISIEIDSINLLTTSVEYNKLTIRNTNNLITDFTKAGVNTENQSSILTDINSHTFSYNAYFQHQGKRKKNRLFSFGYRFSQPERSSGDQIYKALNLTNLGTSQINSFNTTENTITADYAHPIKSLTVESGIKEIWRSNYSFGANRTGQLSTLTDRQNAIIAYNTYYWKNPKSGIKIGLRYEYSGLDDSKVIRVFNTVVPTISLQWKFAKSLLSFNFDEEIERPAIFQLTNFVNQANPAFNYVGNPNLAPSTTYKLEINYNLNAKNFMRFSGYYYLSKGLISTYTSKLNDSVNVISYYNAGTKDEFGIKYSTSVKFNKQLDLSFNSRLSYLRYVGFVNNINYVNDGFEFITTANTNYQFKNGWRASIYLRTSNPYISPQGKGFWWTDQSLAVNKRFFHNLLNCSISLDSPINKVRNRRSSIYSTDFNTFQNSQEVIRKFFLSISYQFGRLRYEVKKADKPISNTDIKIISN